MFIAVVFRLKPALTSSCFTRASLACMIMLAKKRIMLGLIIIFFCMVMLVRMIMLSLWLCFRRMRKSARKRRDSFL